MHILQIRVQDINIVERHCAMLMKCQDKYANIFDIYKRYLIVSNLSKISLIINIVRRENALNKIYYDISGILTNISKEKYIH